ILTLADFAVLDRLKTEGWDFSTPEENVCGRNFDAFYGNEWGRQTTHGETEHDRNLYSQLIGQTTDPESLFCLDALESLPPSELRQSRFGPQNLLVGTKPKGFKRD